MSHALLYTQTNNLIFLYEITYFSGTSTFFTSSLRLLNHSRTDLSNFHFRASTAALYAHNSVPKYFVSGHTQANGFSHIQILQRYRQRSFDRRIFGRAAPRLCSRPRPKRKIKRLFKKGIEDVIRIAISIHHIFIKPSMTELIILISFVFIAKNFISRLQFFKFLRIPTFIRMLFKCLFPERLFNIVIIRTSINTKYRIRIFIRHSYYDI